MWPLLPVNELAMNLTSERVDDRYLKVFFVAQAVVAEVLCKPFAALDCSRVPLMALNHPGP
jgi:hypothetical protein